MRSQLQKARRDAGLTQKNMADYLNISERYYKAMEYGERTGSIELWDRLEDLFKVHQRELRRDTANDPL